MHYTLSLTFDEGSTDKKKYDRIIQTDNYDIIVKTFWYLCKAMENDGPVSNYVLEVKSGNEVIYKLEKNT